MIPSLKLDAVPLLTLTLALPAPASAAAADGGETVGSPDPPDPAAAALAADTADAARERAADVAAMLRLAASEYAEAVRDGEVVNEAEYAESREFTVRAAAHFAPLRETAGARGPAGAGPHDAAADDDAAADQGAGDADTGGEDARRDAAAAVSARLDSLVAVVEAKGPGERYRELAERVSGTLERAWGAVPVPEPDRRPSATRGERLYGQACAACHGPTGRGDGWAAEGMTPAPPDLADPARGEEASPARDYLVIQHGIPETAMPSHRDWLSVGEAWDLVAYLRQLMGTPLEAAPDG